MKGFNNKQNVNQKPGSMAHHTIVVFRDDAYLFGGSNGIIENNKFYKLILQTNEWQILEKFKSEHFI